MDEQATVLVVDDDAGCRELHELWLTDAYDVRTASDGTEALERVESVDVVLLDREMPALDGADVARAIEERTADPFVVMISGVEPGFEIVDLPIDEYLMKPITEDAVRGVVDRMTSRAVCQRLLREFLSLRARKATLERRKRPTELAESDEYRRLDAELEAKRVAVEELLVEIDRDWREQLLANVGEEAAVVRKLVAD